MREDEVERGLRDGTTREEHAGEADPAKGGGVFRAGDMSAAMTFQLIEKERAHHAVSRLCSVLNISPQGYWAWNIARSAAAGTRRSG